MRPDFGLAPLPPAPLPAPAFPGSVVANDRVLSGLWDWGTTSAYLQEVEAQSEVGIELAY